MLFAFSTSVRGLEPLVRLVLPKKRSLLLEETWLLMNGQKKSAEEPLETVSSDKTPVQVHLEVVRIVPPLVLN